MNRHCTPLPECREREKRLEQATQIYTKEIERRLTLLNGEETRLRNIQLTYLPREIYEANNKLLSDRVDFLTKIIFIGLGGIGMLEIILRLVK